ncbi:AAA-domain-containing protein [Microthyrium microscopicum]|uniref:Vesicular-fusion protein SEC18 n=1 Tax=Microthyrium microscopicum TaxID=703497 RepID=A0A6A6UGW0_9PEZI|nr:AAA-domain-containing protein [Microthyrium microscopicum]
MAGGYDSPSPDYARNSIPRQPVGGRPPQQQIPPRGAAPQQRSMVMRPAKSPGGNQFAFGNIVGVSAMDFQEGEDMYLLLNGQFVVTAKAVRDFAQGNLGLTDAQRTWAGISLDPNETVEVQKYDPFQQGGQVYLAALDVMVGFAGRKESDAAYDQDDLAKIFTRTFENQMLAPGQILIMDVKSIPLKIVVQTVQLTDLSMEKGGEEGPTIGDSRARGIVTRNTTMNFSKEGRSKINLKASMTRPATNAILQPNFKFEDMGIGGLDSEFSTIFRRAFASRLFPPGLIQRMGLTHVRGMLLFGPPGTGKTLIARQIGKMLNAREPKVINGPEILNKYVGASEENVRKMFADAEKEYKEKGDESGLHIIIFDELDAVCKQRGSGAGGGTGVGDSVVNQLLSKLDGVDQLNNILLIGMTNRKDMIDDALLRPGRLEVHVEISLPDEAGRAQILGIHTNNLRNNKLLDGSVDINELAHVTKNYSGAEISGLVRAACSFAFTRHSEVGAMAKIKDPNSIIINRTDFESALGEMTPAFGVAEEALERCITGGIIKYDQTVHQILDSGKDIISAVRSHTPLLSVLLYGPPASGKTALAARMALDSEFPFIKFISPQAMVGFNDMMKVQYMQKIFMDADKSPLSIIVIDDIEDIIDWIGIGPRFSVTVVSAIRALLRQNPPGDKRRVVMTTTAQREALSQLNMLDRVFNAQIPVPNVQGLDALNRALAKGGMTDREAEQTMALVESEKGSQISVGIKKVLEAVQISQAVDMKSEKCAEVLRAFMVSQY